MQGEQVCMPNSRSYDLHTQTENSLTNSIFIWYYELFTGIQFSYF